MTGEVCGDNRFEIIADAKKKLIEATNIERSHEEMAVLDSILYRMWQMKWLPGCDDRDVPKKPKVVDHWTMCPVCYEKYGFSYDIMVGMKGLKTGRCYCLNCGQRIDIPDDWEEDE